jgi:hypothetical protein
MWTHIVATIDLNTHKESDDLASYVREKLENAPRITGSEGDADIFVNVLPGYNVSCYANGQHREYQTRVVITVLGDLRDRMRDTTKAEWMAFKKFVDKNLGSIRNFTWKIQGW